MTFTTGAAAARYLTHDVPGIGGVIRQRPEDFLVEELPAYAPSGRGEHMYLFVEKRNLSTFELLDLIAGHFRVRRDAVGYAGLKDRRAITRQVVSVHAPGKKPEDFPMLQDSRVGVLWTDLHTNKLRPGHLRGNRFSIRIRNVKPTDVRVAKRVLDRLAAVGVPNRFGEQRFGLAENNHLVGRAMLMGDDAAAVWALVGPLEHGRWNADARGLVAQGRYAEALEAFPRECRTERSLLKALSRGVRPETALRTLPERTRNFFVSAFQSAVFNAVLDQRLAEDALGALAEGDLAMKHDTRAVFAVDAATASADETRARLARFEISPSGPMWGPGMIRASGRTARVELDALLAAGVTEAHLAAFARNHPGLIEGARRPLRVPVGLPEYEGGVDEHGPFVRVAFELPRGSFATVVLREIMKPADAALADEE